MKTIKNRKSIYAHVFVTALLMTLLLSLLTGIVVAPKPDKPEKPAPPGKTVETWDLTIRIGIGNDDDIVLEESDYQDQDGYYYLFAEDVPCSGELWNFPDEPKGKSNKGYVNAQFSLHGGYNETTGEWEGDDCGTYELDPVPGTNSDDPPQTTYLNETIPEDPEYYVREVDIGHHANPYLEQDYWWFRLFWTLRYPDPNVWSLYSLCAWTDDGPEGEVTPTEGNELLIPFTEVNAVLSSWFVAHPVIGAEHYEWAGTVSFTVKISRTPHVP